MVELIAREALSYLEGLDERPVRSPEAPGATVGLDGPLPEQGEGAMQALHELIDHGLEAAAHSSGPRFFHFVTGGVTPAALGADWLATLLDQNASAWISSPLAVELEVISLDWLKELFELPAGWSGVMTTGATMANFVGLAAARQWWGERHGVDVAEDGFGRLPPLPVFSSGHIHASAIKCLAMLGIGRSALRTFSRDATGRLDEAALETALQELDGAFGLFARVAPRSRHLTEGVERADSVTVDGHKWLNVPYDCGFSFVRDRSPMARAFAYSAAYLPDAEDGGPSPAWPNLGAMGPESSRRARSLAVWATLRAYGRAGYRALVEHNLELAQRMAALVDAAPELERLAEVPLNIVCFRYNPGGLAEEELNRLNDRLGEAILEDGRYYAGTTRYGQKVALRPAIVNWRTAEREIDQFIALVRQLAPE
jgi:glutamate/tyrosine decarboxylase-like PLP-dependent enzyme